MRPVSPPSQKKCVFPYICRAEERSSFDGPNPNPTGYGSARGTVWKSHEKTTLATDGDDVAVVFVCNSPRQQNKNGSRRLHVQQTIIKRGLLFRLLI